MSVRRSNRRWVVVSVVFIVALLFLATLYVRQWRRSAERWNTFLVDDPHAGAQTFQQKGCSECHSVLGAVAAAPDSPASSAPAIEPKPAATPADAERLQSQFQPQLDAFVTEDAAKLHLVGYAPPLFAVYHHQVVLQFSMRNPLAFEKASSPIYKHAARSIDLFLAPLLNTLIQKLPSNAEFDALDFTVLNRLGAEKSLPRPWSSFVL